MKTMIHSGTVAVIALALWGCGTASPETDGEPTVDPSANSNGAGAGATEDNRGLVYSLQVAKGHEIRFYRPGEVLIMTERAPAGTRMLLQTVKDASPAGLFAAVRPGQPLPAELSGFEQLPGGAGPTLVTDDSTGGNGGESLLIDKHADSSGAHFRDEHRMCPTSLRDIIRSYAAFATGCWLNVGGPGSTWASATHSQTFAGSYFGNTQMSYSYDGRWQRTDTILEGQNFGLAAWSGKNSDGYFVTKQHRYDFTGTHRHVGTAYVKAPSARGPLSWQPVW
jgi:hypothetical protein